MIERERKWLLASPPDDLPAGTAIRQGYLGVGDERSLRIRQKGERYFGTIKLGTPPSRTEVEWVLDRDQFEALWPHTDGQRVEKVRHEVPVAGVVAEIDVFGGALDGLVIAEVEFDSDDAMAAFEAPEWFGVEVTDVEGYGNVALARDGIPPDHHTRV